MDKPIALAVILLIASSCSQQSSPAAAVTANGPTASPKVGAAGDVTPGKIQTATRVPPTQTPTSPATMTPVSLVNTQTAPPTHAPPGTPTSIALAPPAATSTLPPTSSVQVIYRGLRRPHGIGYVGGAVYVSSEVDKALFKLQDSKLARVALLNFPHDMLPNQDGSFLTPVFFEDRVVRISPEGRVTEILKGLSGPNGIARDDQGNLYVSNYTGGSVVSFGSDAKLKTVSGALQGPAGLTFDDETHTLYVAQYLGNRIAMITGHDRAEMEFAGLVHFESLALTSNRKLLATAVLRGKGVVVEVGGPPPGYKVLLSTDLPDPLVGAFTREGEVYLVSPNDPQGRVLRARIE